MSHSIDKLFFTDLQNVDQKKLEKAEAKLKAKQERREEKEDKKPNTV